MDEEVVDTKPFKEYAIPTEEESHYSIVHPLIVANNFEIKLSLVDMVQQIQFSRLPIENSNLHLSIFVEFCDTLNLTVFAKTLFNLYYILSH